MTASKTGAMRDNKGKLPFSLVPYEVVEAIAAVLYYSSTEGGGKYPKNNWKKGAEHSIPMDSLLRHSLKRCRGEMKDEDSGLNHSWHMLVNAAFLVYYEQHHPEMNDLLEMITSIDSKEENRAKTKKRK